MSSFVIEKRRRQTQYFEEDLGEGVSLDMILIPSGTFMMGSPAQEEGHHPSESPQHSVTLSRFFMGRYPVTQQQWQVVAQNLPKIETELEPNPSKFSGPLRPVEQVSWHEAVEFCQRVSRATQRTYRLPSEAEWEYACRAGTQTPFHFGETITTDIANYRGDGSFRKGNYGDGELGICREETVSIKELKTSNSFGLCDMHGNVLEWCQDYWHDDYQGAPDDGSAWITGGDSDFRILRGGSWGNFPANCRSARRYFNLPRYRDDSFGFRVVCAVPRTS